ncbi:MAG: single-stranded DNA-binding protein [Thermoflexales bacterium]|nr:single-stranded DNA-binding protein [Thermoflexales bacterium]
MYQSLTIVGNLGKDPEMRYLPDGRPVTEMSVATNRVYNDQSGQQVKETTWFRVSVFGKQAEACAQYLKKGKQVLVEGRLRPDKETGAPRLWQRQDGTYGASFEVFASTVRFLGGRGEGGASAPASDDYADAPEVVNEENIPF